MDFNNIDCCKAATGVRAPVISLNEKKSTQPATSSSVEPLQSLTGLSLAQETANQAENGCTCCCQNNKQQQVLPTNNNNYIELQQDYSQKSYCSRLNTLIASNTVANNYNTGDESQLELRNLLPIHLLLGDEERKERDKEELIRNNREYHHRYNNHHHHHQDKNNHANLLLINQLEFRQSLQRINYPLRTTTTCKTHEQSPQKISHRQNQINVHDTQDDKFNLAATKNSSSRLSHSSPVVAILLLIIIDQLLNICRESSNLLQIVEAKSALSFEVSPDLPRINLVEDKLEIQQFNKSIEELVATLKDQSNLQATSVPPKLALESQNIETLNSVDSGQDTTAQGVQIASIEHQQTTEDPITTTTTTTLAPPEQVGEENGPSSVDDDYDAPCGSSLSDDESTKAKNTTDNEKLVKLQSCLQKQMKRHVKDIISATYDMSMEMPISGRCMASSMKILNGLQDLKSWAFKFVDASAKLPNGFMSGMLSDLGDFDQCLSIRTDRSVSPSEEEDSPNFSGKYCLMSVKLNYRIVLKENETVPAGIDEDGLLWEPLLRKYWTSKSNKGYQIGICLPSKCNNEDIDLIYNHTTHGTDIIGGILNCQDSLDVKRNQTADFLQRTIMCLFLVLLVTVVMGTIINIMCPCMESNLFYASQTEDWSLVISLGRFFVSFSIIRNWKIFIGSQSNSGIEEILQEHHRRLLVRCKDHQNKIIGHLSGIKLLVIGWIMIGHSFLYPSATNYQYYRAIAQMDSIRDSIWFATTNFTLGIDSLLYISGFLFVYKAMAMNSNNNNTIINNNSNSNNHLIGIRNIVKIIWHKILRFWPTYLTVVGLAILSPLFGEGPLWPEMVDRRLGQACRNNWWSNLLFINNYQDEQEICLPSSWFISILMQAFLVGSIVILVAQSFSINKALISLSFLVLGTIVASFCHAYLIDIDAPVVRMDESFVMNIDGDIFTLYTRLYNNLGPFLIGMAGGFILVSRQRRESLTNRKPTNGTTTASSENDLCVSTGRDSFWLKLLLTILMTSIAILVLSSVFITNYSRLGSAIYWSLNRIGWAIATGHLMHRCATNEWLLVKRFLSLSTFRPMSKLIFVAYLIYPIFIHVHTGLVRDGLHISPYNMINIYITRLVFTFGAALIVHLFVEIPFCTLEENFLNNWLCNDNNQNKNEALSKLHPLLTAHPLFGLENEKEQTITDQLTSRGSYSESSVDYTSNDTDEVSQLRVYITE